MRDRESVQHLIAVLEKFLSDVQEKNPHIHTVHSFNEYRHTVVECKKTFNINLEMTPQELNIITIKLLKSLRHFTRDYTAGNNDALINLLDRVTTRITSNKLTPEASKIGVAHLEDILEQTLKDELSAKTHKEHDSSERKRLLQELSENQCHRFFAACAHKEKEIGTDILEPFMMTVSTLLQACKDAKSLDEAIDRAVVLQRFLVKIEESILSIGHIYHEPDTLEHFIRYSALSDIAKEISHVQTEAARLAPHKWKMKTITRAPAVTKHEKSESHWSSWNELAKGKPGRLRAIKEIDIRTVSLSREKLLKPTHTPSRGRPH